MSTLYGSQAIGGVINMVTKAGKGPLNVGAYAELGTRLTSNSGGYLRGSVGRFDYNLGRFHLFPQRHGCAGTLLAAKRLRRHDPYRNVTLAGRLGFQIDDNTRVNYFGRFIDTQVKYDQVGLEDPNAGGFAQQFFNRLEFDGSYFDGRWKPTLGINYSTIYRHDQDFRASRTRSLHPGRLLQWPPPGGGLQEPDQRHRQRDGAGRRRLRSHLGLQQRRRCAGLGHHGADRSLRSGERRCSTILPCLWAAASTSTTRSAPSRPGAPARPTCSGETDTRLEGVLRHGLQAPSLFEAVRHGLLLRRQPQHPAGIQPRLGKPARRAEPVQQAGECQRHLLLPTPSTISSSARRRSWRCRASPTPKPGLRVRARRRSPTGSISISTTALAQMSMLRCLAYIE